MKFLRILSFLIIPAGLLSCAKEQDLTPANLYGTWEHFFSLSGGYNGLRFYENGAFEYLEKENRKDDWTPLSWKTNDPLTFDASRPGKVYIYRYDSVFNSTDLYDSIVIKSLTRKKLIEYDDFEWTREEW
jgi:hypothetical protein